MSLTVVVSSDTVIPDVCSTVLDGTTVSCDSVALSDSVIRFPGAGGRIWREANRTLRKPHPL